MNPSKDDQTGYPIHTKNGLRFRIDDAILTPKEYKIFHQEALDNRLLDSQLLSLKTKYCLKHNIQVDKEFINDFHDFMNKQMNKYVEYEPIPEEE